MTTVLSMKAMLEPRIVAARTQGAEDFEQGAAPSPEAMADWSQGKRMGLCEPGGARKFTDARSGGFSLLLFRTILRVRKKGECLAFGLEGLNWSRGADLPLGCEK